MSFAENENSRTNRMSYPGTEPTASTVPSEQQADSVGANAAQLPASGLAFSLTFMFQLTTASAIFFAVMMWSPAVAIISTLILTPALMRTLYAAELYRRESVPFTWLRRAECFAASIGVVIIVAVAATIACVGVSLMFGLLGAATSTISGAADMFYEAGVLGTAGGMIWGMAAGMIAGTLVLTHMWKPLVRK